MVARSSSIFFLFSLLLLVLIHGAYVEVAANPNPTSFLRCFLNATGHHPNLAPSSQLIYAPNSTSYAAILTSSVQNLRTLISADTAKPSFIVLPTKAAHAQAAVVCSCRHGLPLRVRSGGHDYEGLSYVSAAGRPFVVLDLSNLRSISFSAAGDTAWVGAGATVGEVYYSVAAKNDTAGFPAGVCPTIGVGGHFSGGGIGTLQRKYGVSADNVVDALIVNAAGEILNRESMGEDLFWAIRGGGATSFGVVLYYKIRVVHVPPKVTVFTVRKTLKQNATKLLERWQHVAPRLADELWIRTIVMAIDEAAPGNRTIQVTFQGVFLGGQGKLLVTVSKSFPELGLAAADCREMSWVESTVYIAGRDDVKNTSILLDRTPQSNSSFKAKSDFVRKPIGEREWEGVWKLMVEAKDEPAVLIMEPWGGRMAEIAESAIAFPHRKGNLYNLQYYMSWVEREEAVTKRHLDWMRKLYESMTPYVSSNPRAAYLNYRDMDLGSSTEERRTRYREAAAWGRRYYVDNYKRLAKVKAKVDPANCFWNEQSIPPFSARRN